MQRLVFSATKYPNIKRHTTQSSDLEGMATRPRSSTVPNADKRRDGLLDESGVAASG